MRKTLSVLLAAVALAAACGGGTPSPVAKPSAPLAPVVKYRNTLPGLMVTGTIDLVQAVLEFAPGAATSVHMHNSPNLATVLQGQLTAHTPAGDKQAGPGDNIVEPINQPVQAVNSGSGEAMLAAAYPVAHGSKPSSPVAGQAAPATLNKTLYIYTLDSPSITGGCDLIQLVLDFASGAQTAKHRHGGPGVLTVLQGTFTLDVDGVEKTYNAGDSFVEMPGQVLHGFNRGSTDLVVVASYMVPQGVQLTTNV